MCTLWVLRDDQNIRELTAQAIGNGFTAKAVRLQLWRVIPLQPLVWIIYATLMAINFLIIGLVPAPTTHIAAN